MNGAIGLRNLPAAAAAHLRRAVQNQTTAVDPDTSEIASDLDAEVSLFAKGPPEGPLQTTAPPRKWLALHRHAGLESNRR
jgi:hypothetical protein